jgi:hypothetical protein
VVDLPRVRAALARLDACIATHGDKGREICDRLAADLPGLEAANDDAPRAETCPCPDCEGRGDAGEGDL